MHFSYVSAAKQLPTCPKLGYNVPTVKLRTAIISTNADYDVSTSTLLVFVRRQIDNLRVAIYSKELLRFTRRKNNDKIALTMQWSVVF